MPEDSDQEQQLIKKAKTPKDDFDNAFTEEDCDMLSQKVAKIEQDVQNVNDRFQREISPMFGKVMETEIPKIMDKAVVHSVSESSSQESYFRRHRTEVFADCTAVEDAVKRLHQGEIEAQRQRLRKEGYEKAVAENWLGVDCWLSQPAKARAIRIEPASGILDDLRTEQKGSATASQCSQMSGGLPSAVELTFGDQSLPSSRSDVETEA
eukprot:g19057.t1